MACGTDGVTDGAGTSGPSRSSNGRSVWGRVWTATVRRPPPQREQPGLADVLDYREDRMPISASVFDKVLKKMIQLCDPDTVLDIGPGAGKYARMLLAIEAERKRPIRKLCVEIDNERVVQRFDLRNLYDEVINEDAARLAKRYPVLTGDIAIAGDVIEHLTKSEGVDLIEYLQYRFKHIFLVIPVDWVSLEYQDHRYESHIAIWRPADIARFAGSYCIQRRIDDGHKFLLASINSITLSPRDYFVIKNKVAAIDRLIAWAARRQLSYEEAIDVGFLNR